MFAQKTIEKVLFYQPWGIGDMIMFSPVLLNFRRYFPNAQIDLACRPAVKNFMAGCDWISTIYELLPPPQRTIITMINTVRKVRKQNYDLVFAAAPATTNYMGNLFVQLSGAKYTVGNTVGKPLWDRFTYSSPANRNIHRVEQNKLLFKALMGENVDFHTEFYKPADKEDEMKAESILTEQQFAGKKILGVHAGCDPANAYRRWKKEKFHELLNSFLSDYQDAYVIGFLGPEEGNLISAFPKNKFPDRVIIIQEKLGVAAALLGKCHLVLTTDSSIGHIARSMQTPAVAIFGAGRWVETAPFGLDGHVITLEPPLECMPCVAKKKTCDKKENDCMTMLSVEAVKKKLYQLWNKYMFA